ncbi:restriction endonuclease subunit S [Enterococcus faecium]|nr:restriction endonuclease subunit S [Enterococcus faecium]EMF0049973.1 restriction endonuclease subunit S [Enterococcus hirae]KAA9134738.1 restriction endonuclease subunit S [Enterococcus faecium]KAA9136737.1 restriction endonuclease subunit S [Enterococcus faecium]KAA9138324.1 restriction endonuclease subunit S [Enterococcus faecium]KAA9143097.1 restriction endonuclease subunit S [Enterococcus faecium]
MKDSGVEWIGGIPESWELVKIGQHFKQRNEKVSDLDFKPLSVTKNGIVPQLDNAAKSSNHNDRKLVKKGDFVINSRSDRKQSSGIAYEDGSVSLINLVIKSRTVDTNFTNYLLKNAGFAEEFYRWGNGIVADLWSTKWDSMKRIPIPLPELAEQKKVANVIRDKVKIIDTIISETQQSINELKKYKQALITETVTKGLDKNVEMKDSGIEWIGEIPAKWEVKRIGNYYSQVKSKNLELQETNLLSLSYGKIIRRSINVTEGLLPNNFTGYNIVQPEDIVLRMTDLQNDHVSLRTGLVQEKGIITSAYITIRKGIYSEIDSYYIHLFLYSFDVNKGFYGMGSGVRQGITFNDIKKIQVIVPPYDEQQNIINYLRGKSSAIDNMIIEKKDLVTQLNAYKQSLIYEYVTGKKEA